MNNNYTKEELIALLKISDLEVSFTKVDGSKRVMNCTLRESAIPDAPKTESVGLERKINNNVVSVWDLDNDGWRSFKIDSLEKIVIKDDLHF
jgi:hypothetical protein